MNNNICKEKRLHVTSENTDSKKKRSNKAVDKNTTNCRNDYANQQLLDADESLFQTLILDYILPLDVNINIVDEKSVKTRAENKKNLSDDYHSLESSCNQIKTKSVFVNITKGSLKELDINESGLSIISGQTVESEYSELNTDNDLFLKNAELSQILNSAGKGNIDFERDKLTHNHSIIPNNCTILKMEEDLNGFNVDWNDTFEGISQKYDKSSECSEMSLKSGEMLSKCDAKLPKLNKVLNCDEMLSPNRDESLSQLCESSQFLRQIDNAISVCQVYENVNSSLKEKKSNDIKKVISVLKENEDEWDEVMAHGISQLFKSSQYRREVETVFDKLETSICQIFQKDTSINSSVWVDDSLMLKVTTQQENEGRGTVINKALVNSTLGLSRDITQRKLIFNTSDAVSEFCQLGPFYGLPKKVKDLIKMYKGIDGLYDWQDECLKLDAINNRKNLVYALPTSGGKTLVSEILMIREVMCRRRNAIFVLPYVSIVQEKVCSLSPFAVALDFLIEEYAAGKGIYPPRKRRYKNSIFICTIEKALGLCNSLIENDRIKEIGLVVVDELHLLGEAGRGATLETLLTKLMYMKESIHIVGMSATIGNLPDICKFLNAESYTKDFRPVELKEYVKCGNDIAQVNRNSEDMEDIFVLSKTCDFNYTETASSFDPDRITGLVMEVVPNGSCLIFCASKKNCENVAQLLCRVMNNKLLEHKRNEKLALIKFLQAESILCPILGRTLPHGIAYHHSGLTADERRLIEDAFRAGTICVICCTSTLAAGVNLPAKRVILRSPYVGRDFISLSKYKQMIGRAGRAGFEEIGESFLICDKKDVKKVAELLCSPMDEAVSSLTNYEGQGLRTLILSCISLGIATNRKQLRQIVHKTLMAVQSERLQISVHTITDKAIVELIKLGAIQLNTDQSTTPEKNVTVFMQTQGKSVPSQKTSRVQIVIGNDSHLIISKLGKAAIKGGLELSKAHLLYEDLIQAQTSLVLLGVLHLLYLVTPYELVEQIKPSMQIYYSIYIELGLKELQTAKILGITESCATCMLSGQPIKNVPERVLNRFYLTLMLHDLWNGKSVFYVADHYQVSRGIVQQLMTSSATFASCVVNFCDELSQFWAFADLFRGMSLRLQHCSARELDSLMQLPAVKQGRAKQLYRAGYKTLQHIAKADPSDLVNNIEHMPRRVANQLIAAAKLLLLEKVENLREEAEDVFDGI